VERERSPGSGGPSLGNGTRRVRGDGNRGYPPQTNEPQAAWLSQTFAGYSLYFSTWKPTKEHPAAHAGVMLAINQSVAKGAKQLPFRNGSRGRILEVKIDTPGESGHTTMVAAYAPHVTSHMESTEGETHTGEDDGTPLNPVEVHLRNLSAAISDARARGDEVMVAWDHNAVTMQADRTGKLSQRDKDWTEWVERNGMKLAGRADTDTNTHSYQADNDQSTTSRIDDWMTSAENKTTLTNARVEESAKWTHGSDHEPVTTTVTGWSVENVGNTTPDWSRQTMERINMPKAEDRERTTQEIWDKIASDIDTVKKLVMTEGTPTDEEMTEADVMINKMGQKVMQVVKHMWGLQTQAKGEQGNGKAPWMPRAKKSEYKKHMTTAKRLRKLTTYVTRRYSDDPHHAEDHTALYDDAEVERMT